MIDDDPEFDSSKAIMPTDPPDPVRILGPVAGVKPSEFDLARARRLWDAGRQEFDPDFNALPKSQQVFGALLSRLVQDGDIEPTYACPSCLDLGYTHDMPETVVSQDSGKRVPTEGAEIARFCTRCDAGLVREAGMWAGKVKPARGRRTAGDEVKARWFGRLRAHPRGADLRAKVEALVDMAIREAEAEERA